MTDEYLGGGVYTVKTDWFDRKKMEEIQRYATAKFHNRPVRLLRKALEDIEEGNFAGLTKRTFYIIQSRFKARTQFAN